MTHPINLEVGMAAIRRDGERAGPVVLNGDGRMPYSYILGRLSYKPDGSAWSGYANDIIAAGYPWAELGAQVGDTVRCVWSGYNPGMLEWPEFIKGGPCDIEGGAHHPDSLYVIEARAAKPADRPRAAHKLNLRDGDVVELVAWQDGGNFAVGTAYTFIAGKLVGSDGDGDVWDYSVNAKGNFPKGERPLFRVISRAADAKPDEVVVLHGFNPYCTGWSAERVKGDAQRLTITFPHGGNTGTVEREDL